MSDKEREIFEAWYGAPIDDKKNNAFTMNQHISWTAWQARSALPEISDNQIIEMIKSTALNAWAVDGLKLGKFSEPWYAMHEKNLKEMVEKIRYCLLLPAPKIHTKEQ